MLFFWAGMPSMNHWFPPHSICHSPLSKIRFRLSQSSGLLSKPGSSQGNCGVRTSVRKRIKRTQTNGTENKREKGKEKQWPSSRFPVCTRIGIIFPLLNKKSIIPVNYLCLHAMQETSEMFLHKEENVYRTLSKV